MSQSRGLRPLDPIFSPGKRLGAIAVGNTPGTFLGIDLPRFSWDGLVDSLDQSPEHSMEGPMTLLEAHVCMRLGEAAIEFDVMVDGVSVASVSADGIFQQGYDIDVPVIINSRVAIDVTDFGTGLAEKVSIVLRPFITPRTEI